MKVYKYNLKIDEHQVIPMQLNKILSVGLDAKGIPCIWVEVDLASQMLDINIYLVYTGEEIHSEMHTYIGTFEYNDLIYHVYTN